MSNLGQIAATAVGAVVGFLVAGPMGAVYGMNIGLLAGSYLFPTELPGREGPRLEDFEQLHADPGAPVHVVFGTAAVPGFRMYLGPVREVATTETVGGGKQRQEVTTFAYFQTIAIGLCEGPIKDVTRIWENGKLVYDSRPQQPGESDKDYQARAQMTLDYAKTFDLYTGSEDQLPDPTLELERGVGAVPAFRGLAYIVFPERQLRDDQGRRHPVFKIEVSTEPSSVETVLLLHFDQLIAAEPPTSYVSSYIDSSPNGFHVSTPGWANPAAIDLVAESLNTSDKRFGAACLGGTADLTLFVEPDRYVLPSDGGRGAYLEAFGFGVGDFTIEFQVRRFPGAAAVAHNPLNIYGVNNTFISFLVAVGGSPSAGVGVSLHTAEGNVTLFELNHPSDQWFHIALSVNTVNGVRTARLYRDGVLKDSADITGFDFGSAGQCFISALHNEFWSTSLGNIDEIRIVKGAGLYPTGFDPPTGPFS